MTEYAHDLLTASDATNKEADEHFRACRPDEGVRLLEAFLAGHRDALPPEELLRTHANIAAYERARGDFRKALRVHLDVAALADACHHISPRRCGQFHNGLGLTYLALFDEDPTYDDRAIESFTAAGYYYNKAGAYDMVAAAENNLAAVHVRAGRVKEALAHLANAYGSCKAHGEAMLGQFEDTRAQIALAAGDPHLAREVARISVARLEGVGQLNILIKSQKTLARAERACLSELEGRRIREVLDACRWNLTHAAAALGLSRQAFKLHLKRKFPGLDRERRNKSVSSSGAI